MLSLSSISSLISQPSYAVYSCKKHRLAVATITNNKNGYEWIRPVTYLGFHKKGGILSLATNAFTKGGQTFIAYFFPMVKADFFLTKETIFSWPNGSPKYATGFNTTNDTSTTQMLFLCIDMKTIETLNTKRVLYELVQS